MEYNQDVFLKHLAQTTPHPFQIPVAQAEGIYLFEPGGKKYIDLIAGIGVTNIGHRHHKVVAAIKSQLDHHLHVMVYGEYIQATPNLLAHFLTTLMPPSLNCCYFVNSGTEANEGALKLAKRATGRTEIISFNKSYHGSTHGSLSVSGNEKKKNAFRPLLPGIRFINFNDLSDLEQITSRTACVIMETVQGDAGVRIPTRDFMLALRKKCNETGTLLILDEIQCGMGRTGTLFAFEQFNIVPDILTIGKAFGGGLPIGAFIADQQLMNLLTFDPMLGHITTFGGNPVCCASALATLQVMQEEKIVDQVEEKGKLFEGYLVHPAIIEIRRIGMFFAIDFESEEQVQKIVTHALELGIICFWFLSCPNSLRIAPPLTINKEEIKIACNLLLEAIERSMAS